MVQTRSQHQHINPAAYGSMREDITKKPRTSEAIDKNRGQESLSAAMHVFAASVVERDRPGCSNINGNTTSANRLTSADHQPPLEETGLDLAVCHGHLGAAGIRMANTVSNAWRLTRAAAVRTNNLRSKGGWKKNTNSDRGQNQCDFRPRVLKNESDVDHLERRCM